MADKITSPKDLQALRDKAKADLELREGPRALEVTMHMGTCGIAAGARDVLGAFLEAFEKWQVNNATLRQAGCVGLCDREPMVTVKDAEGNEYHYGNLDKKKVERIVREHVVDGTPVIECFITK